MSGDRKTSLIDKFTNESLKLTDGSDTRRPDITEMVVSALPLNCSYLRCHPLQANEKLEQNQ